MSDFIDGLRAMATAALFPTEGELTAPGLAAPVTVRRDEWGVPYIEAGNLDDLWFAQGFVTAGERLFQLDLLLRASTGRLSEVFAERTLAEDRFARTIGLHRAGAQVATDWDETDRAMHGRFREGVAAWIAQMPALPVEYTLLDLRPELPDDEASWAAAFAFLAWGLSGNWDQELLRAWIRERAGDDAVRTLMPPLPSDPPAVAAGALHGAILDALPRHKAQGSNDWVVAPSRSATGGALLANDPHLLALQPGAWIELHLSAPGYRARGVALTFSPGILLGTTAHHAWGVTNVSGDVQDLYVERLNDDRTAAEYDGGWEPLTSTARRSPSGATRSPHVLEVRETRHGPILDTFPSGILDAEQVELPAGPSLRPAMGGTRSRDPPVADAPGCAGHELRDVPRGRPGPGVPRPERRVRRRRRHDRLRLHGTVPGAAPGRRDPARARVDGRPRVGRLDPRGGAPVVEGPRAGLPRHREQPDPRRCLPAPDRERLPHAVPGTPDRRGPRGERPLHGRGHGPATARHASRCPPERPSPPSWPSSRRPMPSATPSTCSAAWDGDMAAGSAAAAVFNVWSRHIARRALEPRLGEELFRHYHAWREPFQCQALLALLRTPGGWLDDDLLRAALDDALEELREVEGDDPATWRWGAIHRLRLAHPLASIPGLEPLFLAADVELGGDEQTVMQAGFDGRDGYPAAVIPSWRAVYDLADLDRSVGVMPTGISGNPASAHWSDQTERWLAGDPHPLPFTRAAVDAATVGELRLLPG